MKPKAIVTDIEGTTSSISFVHDTLFPYSRERLADYVASHADQVAPILEDVRRESAQPDMDVASCVARLLQWHDADLKIGPLKTLQGMIWDEGFAHGELRGHVYPDAVEGLRRWHQAGLALYIYSSGSVAAQKLLFGNSAAGDLTPLFSGYFDTAVGGKKETASYCAIAEALHLAPADILFLSDVEAELAAAREAGMEVMLLAREGEAGTPSGAFPAISSFDAILPAEVLP